MPKKFFYYRERPLFIRLGEFIYIQSKTEKSLISLTDVNVLILEIANKHKELEKFEEELDEFLEATAQKDEVSFAAVYKQIDFYQKNIKHKEVEIEKLYLKLGKMVYKQYKEVLYNLKQYDYIKSTIEEIKKWEKLEKIGLKPKKELII
jgi:hypothetical protein